MIEVVSVRFKKGGKAYYFSPGDLEIENNMDVIVETVRGIEYGTVTAGPTSVPDEEIKTPLKNVIRIASDHDRDRMEQNLLKEKEACEIFNKATQRHHLDMKLTEVEYTFDNSKILFYFTADGRVDFRELVKELASVFKTRIELRQIGVRDETKMIGGIGICGRVLCCNSFLNDFHPVSIKMAKDQSLSLNPAKISGTCGRLMCCLKYEHLAYEDLIKNTPGIGTIIETVDGNGEVIDVSLLKGQLKVRLDKENETDLKYYNVADVKIIRMKKKFKGHGEEKVEKVDIRELKSLED